MIRPVTPEDTDALVRLTADTGFFKPLELDALREVLDDYHAANEAGEHRAFAWDEGGRVLGYVYHAPTPMTDRSWHLYWIAVSPDQQGRGLGGQLLAFAEADIREQGGRLLIIETSTTAHYEPTRKFYLKYGYTHAASVPDFYADGDGMAVFTKHLEAPSSTPRGL
jgi:ribosomal protein S18 acetylase RimI-like enzyme